MNNCESKIKLEKSKDTKRAATVIVTIEKELREDSQRCLGLKGLVAVKTVTAVDEVVL